MLQIRNMTPARPPALPFAEVKEAVLGPAYELSLVFADDALMRSLSKRFKGDPTHRNVLSFPLDHNEGEIFLGLAAAREEAPDFDHTFTQHLLFLFIHGCLHLAGMPHGPEMERQEQKLLMQFHTPEKTA